MWWWGMRVRPGTEMRKAEKDEVEMGARASIGAATGTATRQATEREAELPLLPRMACRGTIGHRSVRSRVESRMRSIPIATLLKRSARRGGCSAVLLALYARKAMARP